MVHDLAEDQSAPGGRYGKVGPVQGAPGVSGACSGLKGRVAGKAYGPIVEGGVGGDRP